MKFTVVQDNIRDLVVDTLVIGIYEDVRTLNDPLHTLDDQLGGVIKDSIGTEEFRGKEGEVLVIHSLGKITPKKIMLLGLGKTNELKEDTIRRIVGKAAKEGQKIKSKTMAITPIGVCSGISPEKAGQCISEGALMATYQFNKYKTSKAEESAKIREIYIVNGDKEIDEKLVEGLGIGEKLARGVIIARDMVNEPGNTLTPTEMAKRAFEIAQKHGMEIEILEREDLEKLGMGCFLGVTQGSEQPPKLIVMKYNGGKKGDDVLGFVGKGLTFDSGGISLKPGEGMDAMKGDMGGAAAVLGAMEVIGALKPKVNVIGVVGACENMPSGKAYKPGDILTSMNGKTVEILNTDAEGRLVLVDCISYALKLGATKLVNLATLTGACLVALGTTTTALITNNEEWMRELIQASEEAGEKVWQLPSYPEYKELIKSDIADLKNVGGRYGGTITAGLFLGEFVEDKPWVHMDIAGTSMTSNEKGYLTKGATGVGVRALYHLAKRMENRQKQ